MLAAFIGPLRDDALRATVLGMPLPGVTTMIRDASVVCAVQGGPVSLSTGSGAEALLVDLTQEQVTRVTHYVSALGSNGPDERVLGDGRRVVVWQGRDRSAALPWSLETWLAGPAALAREAAHEVMEYLGRLPPDVLAQRYPTMRARAWSRLLAGRGKPVTRPVPEAAQIETRGRRAGYLGYFRFDTLAYRAPRFDGSMGDWLDREVYVGVDAALVLPYDPVRDEVLLVEQVRLGLIGRGDPQPWSLEPIAGLVDPGEDPADTARREAQEEAGLTLSELRSITGGYASPGYSTDYFHCFLAVCALPDLHGRIGGLDAESENIRVHRLAFDAVMAMVDSGEIDVVPLVMMLLWLSRHRAELRASA